MGGVGRENRRYTDGLQPRGDSHGELRSRDGIERSREPKGATIDHFVLDLTRRSSLTQLAAQSD